MTSLKPTGSFSIAWGMIVIPTQYFTATSAKDLSFNKLCPTCVPFAKLNQHYGCQSCGTIVPHADQKRGYEFEKGRWVVITDQDLESIPLPSKTALTIDAFTPIATLDPLTIEKTYYLGPQPGAERAFALLSEGVRDAGVIGIGKVALRQKEQLCCIRWSEDRQNLQLHQLYFGTEVREYQTAPLPVPLTAEERQMAQTLIGMKSKPVDLATYQNDYQAGLQQLLAQKLANPLYAPTPLVAQVPNLDNLAELLAQSIAQAKAA